MVDGVQGARAVQGGGERVLLAQGGQEALLVKLAVRLLPGGGRGRRGRGRGGRGRARHPLPLNCNTYFLLLGCAAHCTLVSKPLIRTDLHFINRGPHLFLVFTFSVPHSLLYFLVSRENGVEASAFSSHCPISYIRPREPCAAVYFLLLLGLEVLPLSSSSSFLCLSTLLSSTP